MRQGNQNNNNKRMRGRNRGGGGKGPNPLTRSYESNGPDVKIRGTALHIAEKYGQLARDAHSAGDRIAAENYFQHAEHYYRIIAAAQAQMPFPQQQVYRNSDDADDEGDEFGNTPQQHGNQPSPQGQSGHANREGEQSPGYTTEGQPQYAGNGHTGPAAGMGDQPPIGESDAEGDGEDDEMMESSAPPNGGNQPQGQAPGQGQFRRRRRPHRGGGRPENRDGNDFNAGPQGGGGSDSE